MNLYEFENRKTGQEQVIASEAFGESEATFAHREMEKVKHKLEAKKRQQRKLKTIFGALVTIIILLVLFAAYSLHRCQIPSAPFAEPIYCSPVLLSKIR